jgi:hypothetical protein
MKRAKGSVCLGLLVLALGMAAAPARGDDVKNQPAWDKLKKLSVGQQIQVVQNGAQSTTGSFRSVTDEAIVVSAATGEQTISRQSVVRVSTKGSGHRARNAVIGAGIGAGAGAGIGAAVGGCGQGTACIGATRGEITGVVAGVGAIVGAIVGAVLPSGGWHEVYRAR